MPIAPVPRQAGNNRRKPANRKMLTREDREALPFIGKRYHNPNSPENGQWQEDRIVRHVISRLQLADNERRVRVQRMTEIDTQISGVVRLDAADRKRDKDNKLGRKPKPTAHNIPLVFSQIDDAVTYCMSLFAPEMNMFIATSTAKKQSVADGLTREIGKHGQVLQYYRQVAKFVYNSIKYNFGAITVNWEKAEGITYAAAEDASLSGQITQKRGIVWEGNRLISCDMYNFLYDTSVHPVDLPLMGEWFAQIKLLTPFRARRMADQKILFGVDRFINQVAPIATDGNSTFYMQPPIVREPSSSSTERDGSINWNRVWNADGSARESQLGIEIAWYTGWMRSKDFDLSDNDGLELWLLGIVNGQYVAHASVINATHDQLPCACSTPIEDDLNNDQRTYAEMLFPFQHFASFLMNTHVDATRKSIYGITVYDKNAFPGLDLDTEDLIGARIPMKSTGQNVDIDKMFRHYNDAPQTDQNVEMIGKIVELMQKILPTNMANQVADLERATEYQAAATVQASSRRNLKIARTINDQAINPIKFQMMYNIYENMTAIEYVGPDGNAITVTPQEILAAQIEFDVGTGLKGLDRLMQIGIFKDLMAYLFQVKGMDQQVDLLGLLSYVTKVAGFETDLSTFRIAPPAPPTNDEGVPTTAGGAPPNVPMGQ